MNSPALCLFWQLNTIWAKWQIHTTTLVLRRQNTRAFPSDTLILLDNGSDPLHMSQYPVLQNCTWYSKETAWTEMSIIKNNDYLNLVFRWTSEKYKTFSFEHTYISGYRIIFSTQANISGSAELSQRFAIPRRKFIDIGKTTIDTPPISALSRQNTRVLQGHSYNCAWGSQGTAGDGENKAKWPFWLSFRLNVGKIQDYSRQENLNTFKQVDTGSNSLHVSHVISGCAELSHWLKIPRRKFIPMDKMTIDTTPIAALRWQITRVSRQHTSIEQMVCFLTHITISGSVEFRLKLTRDSQKWRELSKITILDLVFGFPVSKILKYSKRTPFRWHIIQLSMDTLIQVDRWSD